jgi:hypothetical protein
VAAGTDGDALRVLLLLPVGVVAALPPELEEGSDRVESALRAFLESRARRVETLSFGEARREWTASAADLREEVGTGAMSFEGAARHLARRLRAAREFDALVVPSLAFRSARLRTRRVSWDGVERRIETVGEPLEAGSVVLSNTFHGAISAPSLIVHVFSPDGTLIFQGAGGLDLVHRARFLPGRWLSDMRWQLEPKSDPFSDAKLLHEGIAVALDPLLPRTDARE